MEAEAAALAAAPSEEAVDEDRAALVGAALEEGTDLITIITITDITDRECTFSFRFSDLVITMEADFSAFS